LTQVACSPIWSVCIAHMIELNLEPTAAPQSARALLTRVAKAIATIGHGVVLDLQASTATTPAGVRRYVAPSAGASLTALEMSWFSVDAAMASRDGLERVTDCLERNVHEALPVRYGQYEPLSFRYSDTGRQHLIDFLAEEYLKPGSLGFVVWYPKRPVLHVGLSIGVGKSPANWRCHRLTLTLEATVLEQGGWPNALRQLWPGWLKQFTRSTPMSEYCGVIAPEVAPLTSCWMLSVILCAVHSGQEYREAEQAQSLLGNRTFPCGRNSMPSLSTRATSGSLRNHPGWIRRAS
jgi:hypothetical protein